MLEYKPGCPARSLAGHDKGRYFIILEEDGEYVALADGKHRTVSKPKRKKKKHIQLGTEPLLTELPPADEAIRESLKRYKRSQCSI